MSNTCYLKPWLYFNVFIYFILYSTTKACIIASVVFVLDIKSDLISAPHAFVYVFVIGFFIYFKVCSIYYTCLFIIYLVIFYVTSSTIKLNKFHELKLNLRKINFLVYIFNIVSYIIPANDIIVLSLTYMQDKTEIISVNIKFVLVYFTTQWVFF